MITHDSWKRIKEIFHSAQELDPAERSDFLDDACGDDQSIREEVEALLTADAGNDDFLSAPAYEFAASILAGEENEFSSGQKIGRYTILCPLGSGGMGQIYLAKDAELDRNIALKLISPQFAHDSRRVHRFEQEARAASALNHPNICVIHDVGKTDSGRHYIAMEHIQGSTLRQQMSRGPFSVRKALNVAAQVATALASAHASGIVHRDIKPENIMLRPDGYVKILDFGLAKLTDFVPDRSRLSEVPTTVHTDPGMLMGTVKYMSPEQLRETKVDERTDIWSLGIVLYEMLTGATPFEAPTSNEITSAILGPQRAQLQLPEGIPAQLHYTITKALEKDRDHRYQTVSKFAADLRTVQRGLPSESDREVDSYPIPAGEQQTQKIPTSGIFNRLKSQAILSTEFILSEIRSHKRAAIFAGASGVLAFLLVLPGIATFINRSIRTRDARPPQMSAITYDGTSICSAVSPDGKWIAHAEELNGKQHLVLTNTVTSASAPIVAAAEVEYLGITFTRDNNYLYFTRKDPVSSNVYRLALPGGTPVKVKEAVDSPITLSPQQDRFAFVRLDKTTGVYSLVVANIDGSNERVLATKHNGEGFSVHGLAWSPDGDLVVCPTKSYAGGYKVSLMGFDPNDGTEQPIGDHLWFSILEIGWQDDMSSLVVSARDHATTPFQLWRISYPDGVAQKITTDLAEYRGVSLSGKDIVTVRMDISWDLLVATAAANFANPTTVASGASLNYGVSWAGDNRIMFSSMAQDNLNISLVELNDKTKVQLTKDSGDNYGPAVSSDGRLVVFPSTRDGKANIWRMNEDGSDPKQLTFTDGNYYPAISPDNQWVAYDNQQTGRVGIWKVPLEGGEPIRVADGYRMPAFSPDGQFLIGRYDEILGTDDELAIFSHQGGEPLRRIPLRRLDWQHVYWLSNNSVSYIDKIDEFSNVWSYDLDTGVKKQLTNFNRKQIFAYGWSPGYKMLACQLGTRTKNVVLLK
jgi:eukaryotic-like serine/threonine-protein kinase